MAEQKVTTKEIDGNIQDAIDCLNQYFDNLMADVFTDTAEEDMEFIKAWKTMRAVGQAVIEMNRRIKPNGKL